MAKEAEAHAEEDKNKRDTVEARNMLENAAYQAQKMKSDYKDKLTEEDVKTLEEAAAAAQKVVADDKADKAALEAAAKELNDKIMPIGTKMYEAAKDEKPAEDAKPDGKSDKKDGTVEGEVVDEK